MLGVGLYCWIERVHISPLEFSIEYTVNSAKHNYSILHLELFESNTTISLSLVPKLKIMRFLFFVGIYL
jgi:hypothetical protein